MADKHTKDALPGSPLSEPKAGRKGTCAHIYAAAPVKTKSSRTAEGPRLRGSTAGGQWKRQTGGAGSEPACVTRTSNFLPCPPAETLVSHWEEWEEGV